MITIDEIENIENELCFVAGIFINEEPFPEDKIENIILVRVLIEDIAEEYHQLDYIINKCNCSIKELKNKIESDFEEIEDNL